MRLSRLLSVAAVLAAGVCAAWPFRRPGPTLPRPPVVSIPLELTLRAHDVTLQPALATEQSPAVGLDRSESPVARPTSLRASAADGRVALANLAPPPDLPVSFQPRSDLASSAERQLKSNDRASDDAVRRMARPRTYRLRDGDTLDSLAQRFLGSHERAMEIFEANRAALTRPDLLPVGTTIMIPPRQGGGVVAPSGREF